MKTYTVSQKVIDAKLGDALELVNKLRDASSGKKSKKSHLVPIVTYNAEIYLLKKRLEEIFSECNSEPISEDKVYEIVNGN